LSYKNRKVNKNLNKIPIAKFLGRFSKSETLAGFFASAFFIPAGRAATFFFAGFLTLIKSSNFNRIIY